MKKLKLSKAQAKNTVSLQVNGLVSTDKTIQQAVEYVDSMNEFSAHLAFYVLWNAIGKDYVLIPKENVEGLED
jgi:hypothetical protein|tara:strand:- start:2660 stop:2878 length:219 start_codon:yes stop_codon:yes gene_type:complete